jgi:hypothetical protein
MITWFRGNENELFNVRNVNISVQVSYCGEKFLCIKNRLQGYFILALYLMQRHLNKPCLVAKNMSPFVVNSSTASKRMLMVVSFVDGCRMLLLRRRDPIGVRVSLRRPNKHCFDIGLCKFWMSSSEETVETSIIIEPSDGSYLTRRE